LLKIGFSKKRINKGFATDHKFKGAYKISILRKSRNNREIMQALIETCRDV
jgi:hypothetical protein